MNSLLTLFDQPDQKGICHHQIQDESEAQILQGNGYLPHLCNWTRKLVVSNWVAQRSLTSKRSDYWLGASNPSLLCKDHQQELLVAGPGRVLSMGDQWW